MSSLIDKAKKIQCVICDLDGVMTNGEIYLDAQGNEMRRFHVHDGQGLKFLLSAGIHVAVISAINNPIIEHRMKQLGIEYFYKNQVNKLNAFSDLQKKLGMDFDAFAYIGDDIPDLPLIKQVGLGVAVANAVEVIKQHADWQTQKEGGRGAIREVCDLILQAQNKMPAIIEQFCSHDTR